MTHFNKTYELERQCDWLLNRDTPRDVLAIIHGDDIHAKFALWWLIDEFILEAARKALVCSLTEEKIDVIDRDPFVEQFHDSAVTAMAEVDGFDWAGEDEDNLPAYNTAPVVDAFRQFLWQVERKANETSMEF